MHRLRSLSSKATQILLIAKSRVADSKIDTLTSHCCSTQLPIVHALVKMVLSGKRSHDKSTRRQCRLLSLSSKFNMNWCSVLMSSEVNYLIISSAMPV